MVIHKLLLYEFDSEITTKVSYVSKTTLLHIYLKNEIATKVFSVQNVSDFLLRYFQISHTRLVVGNSISR